MQLRMILGPSASGKSTMIYREIAETVKQDPHNRVIIITPEQMTLQVEQRLMEELGTCSLMGPSVYGFKRLAYRVFEEGAAPSVTWLDDVGKSMILQRIAMDHRKELQYFGKATRQKGFIDRLKMMMTEIIQYQLTEESLKEMAEKVPEGSALKAKLMDIALLWRYFSEYLENYAGEGRLMASEGLLDEFASRIGGSSMLKSSRIYIDGYTGFTPQQYRIIRELLQTAPEVTVCLTISKEAALEAETLRDWRDLKRKLYFTAQKTVSKLSAISADLHANRQVIYTEQVHRKPALAHALEVLCGSSTRIYQEPQQEIMALEAGTPEEEVSLAMQQVMRLVQDEGYSYRDIAFACTDMGSYAHMLRRSAALYGIPLFLDDKADVKLNPLVRWIEACCGLMSSGFSREAFLTLLKTGLCGLTKEKIDRLENKALAENWVGREKILQELAACELKLWKELDAFARAVEQGSRAGDYEKAFSDLAEKQGIEAGLSEWAERLEQEGDLLQALQYRRIYGEVQNMMGQLSRILEGVDLNFDEYTAMLKIGIAQCRMGQLPSTLDELTVGDLQRSRIESCRALFILGLQGGSFPMVHSGASLFTDTERGVLTALAEIAQGEKESIMEQYYMLQLTMGKASDRICFLCHTRDETGEEIGTSSLWRRLGKTFPMESILQKPEETFYLPMPYLYEQGDPDTVLELLKGKEDEAARVIEAAAKMKGGAEAKEDPGIVEESLIRQLADPTRKLLSVSQLETYGSCPYRYYLQYALKLKEREVPSVTALEDGNVYHELMKDASDQISKSLSKEEARAIIADLLSRKASDYPVYQTTGRFRYYWEKLSRNASISLKLLSDQCSWSDFKPEVFEWEFSDRPEAGGAPLTVELPDGEKLQLQGKIDRLDLWGDGEQRYVQIIDYKSSSKDVKPGEIHDGVQLQLPIYMEAARREFNAKPAGFFYFTLTPAELKMEGGKSEEDLRMTEGRLSGLYVAEPKLMNHMDRSMVPGGGTAKVLPGSLTAKGVPNKQSKCYVTEGQMDRLQELVHEKIQKAAGGIRNGSFPRTPLADKDKEPCDHCAFKGACPYDSRIPGTRRKNASSVSLETLLQ
ncbi:MAG: PD-(D/E)XK nuclease family protein [Lachnospiraceae bacterium]|nr:PD-(D/E)XK nuclease family protein [Lachnospiraceae bacterium]